MKKLISLFLAIILICFSLVGCSEAIVEGSRENLEDYKSNQVTEDQIEKLNLYIITGENTKEDAKTTVPQNINAYIKEKYRVTLNINYCSAEEYENIVFSAMSNTNESERPDIILINSEKMYNDLRAEDRLLALNDLFASRDFRKITTVIDDMLLLASAEKEEGKSSTYYTVPNNHVIGQYEYIVIDKSIVRDVLHFSNAEIEQMTTKESLEELKAALSDYYDNNESEICEEGYISKEDFIKSCVNDEVSGNYFDKFLLEYGLEIDDKKNYVNIDASSDTLSGIYTYIVIDKDMATTLGYSSEAISKLNTEASLVNLKKAISDYYNSKSESLDITEEEFINKYVKVVSGNYDYMNYLEYGVENSSKKNFVNVSSYPIATKAEAFLSAFAIVKQLDDVGTLTEEKAAVLNAHYSKCMSIIYALNTDVQLKNMLQYGYVGTNYRFEKNEKNENTNYITLIKGDKVTYEMDSIHTGNLFINYYCEEIGWNDRIHNNILRQNAEARLPE